MKVLVINGSPKGEAGNTIQLTKAFLKGMSMIRQDEVEIITLAKCHIEFCKGCYVCWHTPEHRCIIHDDMDELLGKYENADLVIWTTPVHTFGMSAMMKNFLDRLFPLHTGIINDRDNGDEDNGQTTRLKRKHVLIASCGFYSILNNADIMVKHFEIIAKGDLVSIVATEGTLFSFKHADVKRKAQQYLNVVRRAGKEYAYSGDISDATKEELSKRIYSISDYHILAGHHITVHEPGMTKDQISRLHLDDLIHCMGVLMDHDRFIKEPGIVEYNVPDLDITVQVRLKNDGIQVFYDEKDFLPYHVRLIISSERLFQLNDQIKTKDFGRFGDNSNSSFHGTQGISDKVYYAMRTGRSSIIRL